MPRTPGRTLLPRLLRALLRTLFRALLRLRGEEPPAETPRVIERVADLYQLDPQALIGAYLARHGDRRMTAEEILALYRRFLGEVDRLVAAIDVLKVP